MPDAPAEDPKRDLVNALSMLEAMLPKERSSARSALELAASALRKAQRAIDERDQQLELVTAPERATARELIEGHEKIAALERRASELERRAKESEAQLEIEKSAQREERRRLAELEARTKSYDALLQRDAGAFDNFMDRALDPNKPKRK